MQPARNQISLQGEPARNYDSEEPARIEICKKCGRPAKQICLVENCQTSRVIIIVTFARLIRFFSVIMGRDLLFLEQTYIESTNK